VANISTGTLETAGPGEVFVLTSEVPEFVNHSIICKLFDTEVSTVSRGYMTQCLGL
jgi:hypothetical protein